MRARIFTLIGRDGGLRVFGDPLAAQEAHRASGGALAGHALDLVVTAPDLVDRPIEDMVLHPVATDAPGVKKTAPDIVARLREPISQMGGTDECVGLRQENDKLRSMLAKSPADCPYCGLPAADMAKCALGFPGCNRADDLMAGPEPFGAEDPHHGPDA